MPRTRSNGAWGALAAVTMAGALFSLVPLHQGQAQDCPCDGVDPTNCTSTVWINRSAECGGPIYCPFLGACTCPRILRQQACCQLNATTCEDTNSLGCDTCLEQGGQFVLGGTCADGCAAPTSTPTSTPTDTPTATPTGTPTNTPADTPTATPTNTLVPDGGNCADPMDCISGNCVDDTCCTEASCPPGESCDNPGNVGTCSADPTAPAPAISPTGVLLALALLLGIGGVALVRRRRGA